MKHIYCEVSMEVITWSYADQANAAFDMIRNVNLFDLILAPALAQATVAVVAPQVVEPIGRDWLQMIDFLEL